MTFGAAFSGRVGRTRARRIWPRWTLGRIVLAWAFVWISLCVVVALSADILSPYEVTAIDLRARLEPPALFGGQFRHLLGTDELGRDLLSRLLYGTRISIAVALIATVIGAIVGTSLGFIAAATRGIVDDCVAMLIDSQAALPHMVIALMAIAFIGNSLPILVFVIGIYGWERYARISRSLGISMLERGFVKAAHTYGVRSPALFWRHILPNVTGVLIVTATLTFPETMLLESSLSFLGLGLQPPAASLGNMLGLGREHLLDAWWVAVLPGAMIFLIALAVSILGDDLRDRFDPLSLSVSSRRSQGR